MKTVTEYINEAFKLRIRVLPKEKKQIINAIYKELQKNNTTGKFYRDDYWAGVDKVRKDMTTALNGLFRKTSHEYDVAISAKNGGYRKNDDGTQWKEYTIEIFLKSQEEPFMTGQLNCFAAGTLDDPFSMYDMTVQLF
jgi:hypothetical protein